MPSSRTEGSPTRRWSRNFVARAAERSHVSLPALTRCDTAQNAGSLGEASPPASRPPGESAGKSWALTDAQTRCSPAECAARHYLRGAKGVSLDPDKRHVVGMTPSVHGVWSSRSAPCCTPHIPSSGMTVVVSGISYRSRGRQCERYRRATSCGLARQADENSTKVDAGCPATDPFFGHDGTLVGRVPVLGNADTGELVGPFEVNDVAREGGGFGGEKGSPACSCWRISRA